MAVVTGAGTPVEVAPRVRLTAPGLVGTAERRAAVLGTRDGTPPMATPAMEQALREAGMQEAHGIELRLRDAGGAPVAGSRGDGRGIVLSVPPTAEGTTQVALVVDAAGVATWHLPVATTPDGLVTFSLPRAAATAPPPPRAADGEAPPASRGLIGTVGRAVVSVLVTPVLEAGARLLARELAERFERSRRPVLLRRFTPQDFRTAGAGDLATTGWEGLDDGRALLLLHGTFSTSHGGFSGLPDAAVAQLWDAYGGRVLAFDHHTLSATPRQNVSALLDLVPAGRELDVDVVCHSRGGLVARALADASADGAPVRVRSTVFAATPNGGTALADDEHIKAFVDRMTTLLNLLPDGPWSVVSDPLAGVLDVVKVLAAGAVGGLPGLQAMDPSDEELPRLGARADPAARRYAIEAEFEPSGALVSLLRGVDGVVDLVFGGKANDVVVPTKGVSAPPRGAGFPIPEQDRLVFDDGHGVWHCSLFSQPRTVEALQAWCRAGAGS